MHKQQPSSIVKKHFIISLLFFNALANPYCNGQNSLPDSITQKLKAAIADFKNKTESQSIVVSIVHDQDMIFSESLGYADLENKIPATIDTRYPICSITKVFTATMYMQLVERNVIGLNDNVIKYIPEYKVKLFSPNSSPTTLLQLATHTSGLPRNSNADLNVTVASDRWLLNGGKDSMKWFSTNKEILNSLQYMSIEYPPYHYLSPNDRHYSNLGYTLLGIAIERASKIEYSKYLRDNIFKPLKLESTGFLNEPGIKPEIACGYWYNDSTKTYVKTPYIDINAAIYPGGMYSTAKDLSKFISFQFQTNSIVAQKVLSYDRRAMMRFSKIAWKPSYPLVIHEGAHLGYRCIVALYPDLNLGWVILTNAHGINFSKLNSQIRDIMAPVYRKTEIGGLEKFVGTYKLSDGNGSLKIYLKNERLYSTYLEDLLIDKPLISEGPYQYRIDSNNGNSIYYEFLPDENLNIKLLNMGQLVWIKE